MKLTTSLFIAVKAQEGSGSSEGIEARSFNSDTTGLTRGFEYDSFADYGVGSDYTFGDYGNFGDYGQGFYDYDAAVSFKPYRNLT